MATTAATAPLAAPPKRGLLGSGVLLLCGLALLGESLKPVQWLGAALALVSVALINRRRQLWEPQP